MWIDWTLVGIPCGIPNDHKQTNLRPHSNAGGRLAAQTEQSCFYYMMNKNMAAPACRRGARESAVLMILVVYT